MALLPVATDFFDLHGLYSQYTDSEGRGCVGIYLDLVVLLNFLVDWLLLLGTNRLAGHQARWGRCMLGGALGGLYGGACLLPGFRFLGNVLWRLVFLGIMGAVAFGVDKSGWKRCGLFAILSMALGGVAVGIAKRGFFALLLGAGGIWLLCGIGLGGSLGARCLIPLEMRYLDKVIRLTALQDTGNALRDPITGESVMVIGADAAQRLTGLTASELKNPLETMGKAKIPGLRLIPYRTVGQAGGMLLAMRLKDVKVGRSRGPALIAFAPERIGGNRGYQALTGGAL